MSTDTKGEKMAITKEVVVDRIETLQDGQIQVRTATVIKEDDTELSRTFHRHVVAPSQKPTIPGATLTQAVKIRGFKQSLMRCGRML